MSDVPYLFPDLCTAIEYVRSGGVAADFTEERALHIMSVFSVIDFVSFDCEWLNNPLKAPPGEDIAGTAARVAEWARRAWVSGLGVVVAGDAGVAVLNIPVRPGSHTGDKAVPEGLLVDPATLAWHIETNDLTFDDLTEPPSVSFNLPWTVWDVIAGGTMPVGKRGPRPPSEAGSRWSSEISAALTRDFSGHDWEIELVSDTDVLLRFWGPEAPASSEGVDATTASVLRHFPVNAFAAWLAWRTSAVVVHNGGNDLAILNALCGPPNTAGSGGLSELQNCFDFAFVDTKLILMDRARLSSFKTVLSSVFCELGYTKALPAHKPANDALMTAAVAVCLNPDTIGAWRFKTRFHAGRGSERTFTTNLPPHHLGDADIRAPHHRKGLRRMPPMPALATGYSPAEDDAARERALLELNGLSPDAPAPMAMDI